MPDAHASQHRLDGYLHDLRRALRGLPEDHVSDIVNELRSHVLDKATLGGELTSDAVESALAGLGSPEDLARQYRTNHVLLRAQSAHSPLTILRGLLRAASISVAGVFVLVGSAVGFALCAAVVLCAALKALHPDTAGLWIGPEGDLSLRLGFAAPPSGSRELLGWWIAPIGFAMGLGLYLLTMRFGRWGVHQLRGARPAGEA
jgi:hypothetical protein